MKNIIKSFFLFIGLILLFGNSVKSNSEIKIAVPKTISSIPFLEVNNLNIKDKTIKVDFFQDHIMTMAEFLTGNIDIFVTGFTQGLANYSGNKEIKLLFTPVWGVSSLIAADVSIKDLNDLTGKTVLVPFKKSPLELQFEAILKKSGMKNKIKIDYAVPQQAVPMLLTKKADAVCVPEPLVSKLVLSKKAFVVFGFADKWGELYGGEKRTPQVSVFVKKDFAENNREFLSKLIEEINNKIREINKDSQKYSIKYASIFELDEEIMNNAVKNTLFDIPVFNDSKKITLDFLKEIEFEEKVEDEFFFDY